MTSKPREAIDKCIRYAQTTIDDEDYQRINREESVDAIIDAVIGALPNDLNPENTDYKEGYNYAISEVKSILEEAKERRHHG